MTENRKQCSFCGVSQSVQNPLIAGLDGHICEACVKLANQVVTSWGRKSALPELQGDLPVPVELKKKLDNFIIGQDAAKEVMSVAVYNHYKRYRDSDSAKSICSHNVDDVEIAKSNILVVGPTGTGKTLIASSLARIVGVPFAVADATTLTQAGYVGDDVETVVQHLLAAADGNVHQAEWGIIYIDEIDKLARAGETSTGIRDVSGEGVQQALLKLVEGTQVRINTSRNRRREGGEEIVLNTENILFIVGGAFSGLDKLVEQRLTPGRSIGFHSGPAATEEVKTELAAEINAEDLRRFGLIPEFIGRFPVLVTLDALDTAALVRILTEPKNALIRQYRKLLAWDGIELDITTTALELIATRAIERGTGARGLRTILERLLQPMMFSMPSESGSKRLVVTLNPENGDFLVRAEYRDEAGDSPQQAYS